jgi:hypothetical protein
LGVGGAVHFGLHGLAIAVDEEGGSGLEHSQEERGDDPGANSVRP